MPIPTPRAGIDSFGPQLSGGGMAPGAARNGMVGRSPSNTGPATGMMSSAMGGRQTAGIGAPSGFGAIPGVHRHAAVKPALFVTAAFLLGAWAYWNGPVRTARTQAAIIRSWADSNAVTSTGKSAARTSSKSRKSVFQSQKSALARAYKAQADQITGAGNLGDTVPSAVWDTFSSTLVKRPAAITPVLQNFAARWELSWLPIPTNPPVPVLSQMVRDDQVFNYVSWGFLGSGIAVAVFGISGLLWSLRPYRPSVMPVAVPTPVAAPVAAAIPTPRPMPVTPVATPFPPPPEPIGPMITPPRGSGIAAGVAALGSSSAEVLRLVKRLEELENLSERMKGERDETRKELTWTQSALDDFKKRVSDASTMAAASAAQSAGASEQRAAQAEQRVTEAVEQIHEALQRAVEAEQNVSHVKEKAETAEERAAHAEIRAQEMQYQLSRAMERLADLERLAATTRLGGLPSSPIALNAPYAPPALPAPEANGYVEMPTESDSSSVEAMLAAAAVTASPKTNGVGAYTNGIYPNGSASSEGSSSEMETNGTRPTIPAPNTRGMQRTLPQRLTTSKMSDIEAGLKLARSIRTRTQKSASDVNSDLNEEE